MTYEIKDIRHRNYNLKIARREVIAGGKLRKEVFTGGVELGTHVYNIAWLCGGYEIWYVPSHKYFGGIGSQHVAPAMYYLVRTTTDDERHEYAELLFEVEPGAQWRKAIQELKELAKNEPD